MSKLNRDVQSRTGVALIIVLVLIVMLSLGAYAFTDLMMAQQRGTVTTGRQAQARAAVASGVEYMKDYLAMLPEDQLAVGGHWDNPSYFQDISVTDESDGNVRFSIVAMIEDDYAEPSGIRFGIGDESRKLDINAWANLGNDDGASGGGGGGGISGGGEQPAADDSEEGDSRDTDEPSGTGGGEPPEEEQPDGPAPTDSQPPSTDSTDSTDDGDITATDAKRDGLMNLPGMTEDVADAILDWIDEDDEPRMFGAEADVYSVAGYAPRNGPINSLDELLLVQGVTPELLFGADRNHNGAIDSDEEDLAMSMGGGLGSMARGWSAYLTVRSRELPAATETEPIDLNQDDLEALYDAIVDAGFDADTATYIAAYRQSGPYNLPTEPSEGEGEQASDGPPAELPAIESVDGRTVDLTKEGGNKFTSILDLIGSYTQAQFENADGGEGQNQGGGGGESSPPVIQSPYAEDSSLSSALPELMAAFTTGDRPDGRININRCSQPVLSSIPGMNESLVQAFIAQRDPSGSSGDLNYLYASWPLGLGLATVEEMKALWPYVSGNGGVFRAQVIGYGDAPGAFARAEVVIDASDGAPKVVSWRDLSHLGPGLIRETLLSQ